ncbi:O-antigen ligase [Duganella sp. CF402]|uniref:O-antigen ligase family protein n=1 Tax=unclassified Duganella TaxID=2636909 RepID=UPI0008D78A20|nr:MULTISPECIES: O-antigen ligase family protein [unclassified Duganella]RZT10185.1 O-antigen ligase [Duganella sp. BK701]SEL24305.1 O-antigen ligase [Duganella sp. CF402]
MRANSLNLTPAGAGGLADRWCAWPLLILMASSGLPISYSLAPARVMAVADVAEQTAAAASSASTLGSLGNLLLLGGLYSWAGAMLLSRPRSVAAVLLRCWPLLLLMALLLASALWSYLPEKVLLNVVHNNGVLLIALAAAMRYRHQPASLPQQLGLVLGANMALQVAAVLLLPGYAIDWQGRWQGLTVHPNTLGGLGFTAFWANAAALSAGPPPWPRCHWLGCALSLLAIGGADSVTSKVCVALVLLVLLGLRWLRRRGTSRQQYLRLLAAGAMLLVLLKLLAGAVDLEWLYALLGRNSQLTGRDEVWRDAYQAIGARPLLGWSFDDHAYLIASAGMPYSSYHNGVLDLAVNGGGVAVLLLALLMLNWAAGMLRPRLLAARIAPYSVAFVLAYMLHNRAEASYVSPRGQMWVIFLALLLLGACRPPQRQREHGLSFAEAGHAAR